MLGLSRRRTCRRRLRRGGGRAVVELLLGPEQEIEHLPAQPLVLEQALQVAVALRRSRSFAGLVDPVLRCHHRTSSLPKLCWVCRPIYPPWRARIAAERPGWPNGPLARATG